MKARSLCAVWLLALIPAQLGAMQENSTRGDQGSPAAGQVAEEVPADRAKALRYHEALRKRPTPGFLFDRFFDAWLEDSTAAELETFLRGEAEKTKALPDQLLLAFYFSRQGEDVRAIEQFRAALEANPGSAAAWYEKAVTEARTLDFDTALADLAQAAKAAPDDELAVRIAQLRASLLVRNHQAEEAVAAWDELLATRPDDEALLEEIIEQQMAEGLHEQAVAKSDALLALTKDPYQKVMRQMRKGDILQRAGKQPEALAIYGETLRQVGRDTWLERELIAQIEQLFRRDDDLTGLSEHFATLIAAEPDRIALHKSSARLLQELGKPDEAIAAQERIVELTPGDRANREALIGLLAANRQLDKAIAQATALIAQNESDAELLVRLAELQHLAGKPEAVLEALDRYQARAGGKEYATFRAARMLDGFGLPDAARKVHEDGLVADPQSPSRREAFAQWLHDHDQKPAAVELWTALAAGGDRGEVVRIARILVARKEMAAAMDLLLARKDGLGDDSLYLAQLIDTATALQRFEETVPWILQRLELVRGTTDLESVIAQTLRVLPRLADPDVLLLPVKAAAEQSVAAACLQAELLERSGDPNGASQSLETALRRVESATGSGDEERLAAQELLLLQQVRLHSAHQDWAAAVDSARAMVDLPGGRKSVHLRRLVELCQRDGQLAEALTQAGEWRRIAPGNLQPWLSEARILGDLGRPEDALRALRLAARKFPDDPDLAALLAERLATNGQVDEAERVYWRQFEASEQLSDRLRWVEQLGRLAESTGKSEQLIKSLEERRKGNPEAVEPLLALALVHRIADNYEERRAALLEATRRQPENIELLLEIARMEEAEGNWERAIETLEGARRLDSTGRVQREIASVCLEYGEVDRAMAVLQDLVGGTEADPREVEKFVDALAGAGEWDRARDFLAPHAARLPDDFRVQYLAAVIGEELEETGPAIQAFTRLLSVEGEIAGLRQLPGAANSYAQMQREMLLRAMPPGIAEITETTERIGEAYSHEEDSGFSPYGPAFGPAVAGSHISLPATDRDCRQLAVCHLLRLAASLPADERKELVATITRNGFADVELMVEFAEAGGGPGQLGSGLAARYPDSDVALAAEVMNSMQGEFEPEALVRACDRFGEKYPELAFVAAWQLASGDREQLPRLEKQLERLKSVEQPTGLAMTVSMMRGMMGLADESDIPPELESQFNQLLIDWYPKLGNAGMMAPPGYLFAMIVQSLAGDEDPAGLVRFVEAELDKYRKGAVKSGQMGSWSGFYRGGRSGEVVAQLPFPPSSFANLPEHVAQLHQLLSGEEAMVFGMGDGPRELDENWLDKFAAAADAVQDPVLKALLQFQAGILRSGRAGADDESSFTAFEATAKAIRESGQPNLDVMLMEASLATHEERWVEASALLDQARNLPMTQDLRLTVDGALVAIATQGLVGGLDQPENAALASAARAAALRLRRNSLAAGQREELVAVLERLDMNKEAGELEEDMAQAANPGSGFSIPSFSSGNAGASAERITELVNDGKTDSALRLLVQQFESMARPELANSDFAYSSDYEWNEFEQLLRGLKLDRQLLEALIASSESSPRQAGYCGLAHEMFGEPASAVEWYQKAIAAKSRQPMVRVRLLGLQLKDDFSRVRAELDATPEREVAAFAANVLQLADRYGLDYGQRLDVVEQLLGFAESRPDAKPDSLAWLGAALGQIVAQSTLAAQPIPVSGRSVWIDRSVDEGDQAPEPVIPHLYLRADEAGKTASVELPPDAAEDLVATVKANEEKVAAAQVRRRALHERICKVMFHTDGMRADGFTAWHAVRTAAGETLGPEAVELARAATLDEPAAGSMAGSMAQMQMQMQMQMMSYGGMMRGDRSEEAQVKQISPQVFLASHFGGMADAGGAAEITAIADELRAKKRKPDAVQLESAYALYSVAPDGFIAAARQQLAQLETRGRNRPTSDPTLVIEVWSDRGLDVDLNGLLLEDASELKSVRTPAASMKWNLVMKYAQELARQNRLDRLRELLAQVRTTTLGTPEEVRALIAEQKERENSGRYMSGPEALDMYGQLLQTLVEKRESLLVVLEEAELTGFGDSSLGYQAAQAVQEGMQQPDKADDLLAWLETTPFLGTVDQFKTYPIAEEGQSIWQMVLERTSYMGGDDENGLVMRLKERDKAAFGERLLLLTLQGESSRRRMLDALGEELPALEQLDQSRKLELANLVDQLGNSGRGQMDRGQPGPDGQRAAEILMAARGSSSVDSLAKLMEATNLGDSGIDANDLDAVALTTLGPLLQSRPDQFAPAFLKLSSLLRDGNGRRRASFGFDDSEDCPELQLIDGLVQSSPGLGLLPQVVDLARHPEFPLCLLHSSAFSLTPILANELETVRAVGEGAGPGGLARDFGELSRRMAEALGERDPALLIPAMEDLVGAEASTEIAVLQEWAAMELEAKPESSLAKAWAAAVFVASRKLEEAESVARQETASPEETHLTTIIADSGRTLVERWPVGLMLASHDPRLPAGELQTCFTMLGEVLDASGRSASGEWLLPALDQLLEIEDDAAFRPIADKVAGQLEKRLTRSSGGDFQDFDGLRPAFRFFHRIGKPEVITQRLRGATNGRASAGTLALLVRLGAHQPVVKILEAQWSGRDDQQMYYSSLSEEDFLAEEGDDPEQVFSAELAAQLPEFLALFSHEGTRLLAETWVSVLPDPKDAARAVPENRAARLQRLAGRLSGVEFRSDLHREQALIWLAGEPANDAIVGPLLKEPASQLRSISLWGRNGNEREMAHNQKLLSTWIAVALRQNDVAPLRDAVSLLMEEPEDLRDYNFESAVIRIQSQVGAAVARSLAGWSPEVSEKALPELRRFCELELRFERGGSFPAVVMLAHMLSGRQEDFEEWKASRAAEDGNIVTSGSGDLDDLWPMVEKMCGHDTGDSADQRLALVRSVWQFGKDSGLGIGSGHFQEGIKESCEGCRDSKMGLDAIKEAGLMTAEELATHGPALAEINPVDGEIWRQVGFEQLALGKLEDAAGSFAKAVETTTEALDQARSNRKVEYAWVLNRLGRGAEARAALEGVDAALLLAKNPGLYRELTQALEE